MSVEKKTVVVPAKTVKVAAKTKTITTYTCDICGKSADKSGDNRYGSGASNCSLCRRDVCRRRTKGYSGAYTCFEYDPDETGDYPEKYCKICLPLYLPARREMNERHWKDEEDMEKRIKKESLAYESNISVSN